MMFCKHSTTCEVVCYAYGHNGVLRTILRIITRSFIIFKIYGEKCSNKSFSFLLTNKFMKTSLSDDIRITATINKFVSMCLQMQ